MSSDKMKRTESLVDALIDQYAVEPTQYLASYLASNNTSAERLSRDKMDLIFKDQSKYYPQLKVMDLAVGHCIVHIPPTVARDILRFSHRGATKKGVKNRTVKKSFVRKFTKDLNEGKWSLTGQSIIIGADGEVMDGHSRLEAAANSKSGIVTCLTFGITDALSFAHIDVGSVRSRAQVLEMAGVRVDATILAQTALLAQSFENTGNEYTFRGTQGNKYQQAETMAYVENNEELIRSVDFVGALSRKYKLERQASPAAYAFCHYLIKKKFETSDFDALPITPEAYITKVMSGIGINSDTDIEYQVRQYLLSLAGQSTTNTQLCRISSIFKGWNKHLGLPIFGNRMSIRRVSGTTKDKHGNKVPIVGQGKLKEPFTVPFRLPGKVSFSRMKTSKRA